MRVLVSGHAGYIGSVLVPIFTNAGHEVVGLDSMLFDGCDFGDAGDVVPAIVKDVRDVEVADVQTFDAVVHLAALSNDPLGQLNPACTYEINCNASVELARKAKQAGVSRFLFASSCSLYGAAGEEALDETAAFRPVTAYGESKVLAEAGILQLADDSFSPTFLRNATAYGVSPRLRGDLVVNNLVGLAATTGSVLMQSDGTPWRPLVHVEDIGRAFLAAMEADRQAVHGQAFNVGSDEQNYQIRDVAEVVRQAVPGSEIRFASGAGPDKRSYRVRFDKIRRHVPGFETRWSLREGVGELVEAYDSSGLTYEDLTGPRYQRMNALTALLEAGRLGDDLRWRLSAV